MDRLVHEGTWFLLTLNVLIAEQGHFGEGRAWAASLCLAPTPLSEHQVAAGMSWEQGHDAPRLSPPSLLIPIRGWDPNHLAYPFSWEFSSTEPLFWEHILGTLQKLPSHKAAKMLTLHSASQCHHFWVSTRNHRRQERTEKGNLKKATLEGTIRLGAHHKKSPSINQSGLLPGVNTAQVLREFSESFYQAWTWYFSERPFTEYDHNSLSQEKQSSRVLRPGVKGMVITQVWEAITPRPDTVAAEPIQILHRASCTFTLLS